MPPLSWKIFRADKSRAVLLDYSVSLQTPHSLFARVSAILADEKIFIEEIMPSAEPALRESLQLEMERGRERLAELRALLAIKK